MKEIGVENFSVELVGQREEREEALLLETSLITEYNTLVPNGYNILLKSNDLSCIRENSVRKTGREVYQLKENGEYILYPNITEAARQIGIDRSVISNCVNGRLETAGGYKWKLKDESLKQKNHSESPKNKRKPVIVYQKSLSGVLIKEWLGGAPEAAEELGLSANSINRCCRGERKSYNNFIWSRD